MAKKLKKYKKGGKTEKDINNQINKDWRQASDSREQINNPNFRGMYDQNISWSDDDKTVPIIPIKTLTSDLFSNQVGFSNIPFTPGSYFTRPRQRQEEGYGKLTDYFDKKTGKLLGTFANGGKNKKYPQGGTTNKEIGELKFHETFKDDNGNPTLYLKETIPLSLQPTDNQDWDPYLSNLQNPADAALIYEKELTNPNRTWADIITNRFIFPYAPEGLPRGHQSIFRKGQSPLYPAYDRLGFTTQEYKNNFNELYKATNRVQKLGALAGSNLSKDTINSLQTDLNYEFGGNLITENQNTPEMKKGGIHIKPSKKGTFKAQASKMGMGVQEAASKILNAPEGKYSPAMRRKANFAKNFAKADGGYPEVGGDLMNQPYYDFGQSQNNFLTNIKPIDSEPVITELDYNMQPFPELDIQNPYKFDPALTKSLERQSGNKPMLNPEEQAQYDQYNKFKNTKFSEAAPYIPTTSLFNNYYLNKGNQYRKKAIDSFSKLEDGGFGGGDYWNLGSGIANAITADINTAKGYTDIFGTLNTNRQIKAIEAQNKRANLLSQFENPTPTFQSGWGGNNPLENGYVPVGENGMSIKEMGGNGLPNVEIEGKENVKLPNGFSENVSGKTHAEGGIPLNLQVGSQILSEKLKHPETGKSYAKMAKKFQTKKDFKHLESKFSDPLNIKTAELNIQMKEQALDNLFMEQEKNKLLGKHGNKIKESTLEDYTMKYGGKLKQYSPGGVNDQTFTGVNPNVDFKTLRLKESEKQRRDKFLPYEPNEIPTGYGSQLALESIFNDFENQYGVKLPTGTNEQKLQALREYQTKLTPELTKDYKLNFARGNKELYQEYTKSKGYKANKDKEKESQNFYDWAKNSGKLTEDYANKGLWGHEYYNIAPLDFSTEAEFNKFTQDPDWAKVGNYYVDRSANPTDPITYYSINKKYEKPSVASKASDVPSTIDKVSPIEGKSNKRDFIPTITGLQFPDAYLRDPITVNNLQPEFYQPSTISPYLNDIQRLQYASNANLGTSGAELATRANLFGQGLTEYGKRYYDTNAFNAQAKTQAAAQNAQTKQRVNEFNMSNYIQNARNPQLQREATITEQKALNRNAELKKITDMEHEQRVQDYLANIYDPNYAFNANFNPYLSQKPAKYGTKIKLKNKKKK